ncbi:hypothetical protein D3C80_1444230 [compost metagenome]
MGGRERERKVGAPGFSCITDAENGAQRCNRIQVITCFRVLAIGPGERTPCAPVIMELPLSAKFYAVDMNLVAVLVASDAANRIFTGWIIE